MLPTNILDGLLPEEKNSSEKEVNCKNKDVLPLWLSLKL
jgi:hypothetical protein